VAAPEWAAITAVLNQAVGKNLGVLNPQIYPLANSPAFNNAASMSNDFAHVGLGSPNFESLFLALSGQTVRAVSATVSKIDVYPDPTTSTLAGWTPADGSVKSFVVVRLLDDNTNFISGKSVTLAVNAGSSAVISPSSAVTIRA
jgi:hypothetical protein